jgi:hypothetical protein
MHKRKIKLDENEIEAFYYLLGSLEGDGHYNSNKGVIKINVIDKDFIDEVQLAMKKSLGLDSKIFKICPSNKKHNIQYCIRIGCIDFFKKLYHVLRPITDKEKANYLRGLYDAEGSVGIYKRKGFKKWLYLSQKDTKKLDEWAGYLKDLGIDTTKYYKTDGRSYIEIRDTHSIKDFYHIVGFSIKRKMDALRKIIEIKTKIDIKKLKTQDRNIKIEKIYKSTNFGKKYVARMFNMTEPEITQIIRKLDIKNMIKGKITNEDIDIAESVIEKKIPFEIDDRRRLSYNINSCELKTSEIQSISFFKKMKGVDLNTPKYNNFFLSNDILSHNSTIAQQVAYFLAWLIAGGKMAKNELTKKWYIKKQTEKEVHFNLEENIVFSPEGLMKKASELYRKYGRNQVIIYDEGRAGLDSASAMQAINRAMQDFFQECGMYGHVIIIVLPNFFKLHEDYAVNRSLFLIDAFADRQLRRGFFNFYNETQKEWLYYMGKKKLEPL